MRRPPNLVRNDPRQYDELSDVWWDPRGLFASLHWIAEARGRLVPEAENGAVLVDVGCGAGLLAPHIAHKGYLHIGVDLNALALDQASDRGMLTVRGNATRIPLPDECADVVSAGEILEHVVDWEIVIVECCRILRPGGWLILDTLANTRSARLLAITLAERIPGGAPKGIHDHRLFIDRSRLIEVCSQVGVTLSLQGLRPSILAYLAWAAGRSTKGAMVSTRSTATLFQAWGRKAR